MKLIGTESGRVILLLPVEEIRPLDGLNLRETVQRIVEHYEFQYPPELARWEDVQAGVLRFRSGKMNVNGSTVSIGEFEVYPDGFVASSVTTDQAELFIDDILKWGAAEFGLREPQRSPRRVYNSTLVVEFDHDMNNIIKNFSEFASSLAKTFSNLYGVNEHLSMFRFSLKCDPAKVQNATLITEFVIERRVNYPYNYQRFFCQAPLTTAKHMEMLELLERLVSSA